MRTITHHIIPEANTNRTVVATDEPDPSAGGACHEYRIAVRDSGGGESIFWDFAFQHGPVKEYGDNGVTEAQLFAVLIDRYEHFQAGPFASEYNATTLLALKTALDAQHQRTRDRVARNVEGRNQK